MSSPGEQRYRSYMLLMLMAILAFNYMDRFVLGVVMQEIKNDLDLTDTQLGLLSGIAFALFYSVMGVPIARWADRGDRVLIIALTTSLWSIAVCMTGMAGTFLQMLLIRVVVAVGEAGCIPPAHSLIADYYSRGERPRAVARYMLGLPLALTIGYFAAGWLNDRYDWRVTFFAVGLPGSVLGIMAMATLREPRRAAAANRASGDAVSWPPMSEVIATLWRNGTFRHLLLCFSIWYFFGYGLLQWQPAFFIRSHAIPTAELGIWLAAIYGGGAFVGTYLGGEWSARYAAGNERLQLIAVAVVFSFFAVFSALAYLVDSKYVAFGLLAIASVGGNTAQGPVMATIQSLVAPRMRAVALSLLYLFANLIGMGLGPLAAGALSDALRPRFGDESLRYALLFFCPGYFWAAWHLCRASLSVDRDVASAAAFGDGHACRHS